MRTARLVATFFAGSMVVGTLTSYASTNWSPLESGVNNSVFAITADGNGGVFAGGIFTTAGGQPADGIAHWSGETWTTLGLGVRGSSAYVSAIEVSGSDVYVGGQFDSADGVPNSNGIARWNGSTWNALGSGIDPGGAVFALASSGSILYAGGNFTGAGGIATSDNIAQWDGTTWSSVGTGIGADGVVNAVAVSPNGDLYIGGEFTSVDGLAVSAVARWDGSTWSAIGGGVSWSVGGTSPNVFGLAFDGAGNLYVGGSFDQAGTGAGLISANFIAKWDGSVWVSLGNGIEGTANDLVFDSVGRLYVSYYGNVSGTGDIDRWDGTSWMTLPSGADSSINRLAFATPTTLIAGGGFNEIGGQNASRIASYSIPVVSMPGGPTAPIQQFGVLAGTLPSECASLAPPEVDWPALASNRSVGWSVSFAQWPHNGAGGWVCTRQPIYTSTGWSFS